MARDICEHYATIKFTGLVGIDQAILKFEKSMSRFLTFEIEIKDYSKDSKIKYV